MIHRVFMKTPTSGQFHAKNKITARNAQFRCNIRPALVLLFALGVMWTEVQAEKKYYVAPNGNDQNIGTSLQAPFQTFTRAQQAVRDLKATGTLTEQVTIYIKGGTYSITEPLLLTDEDSGNERCPITYTALPGEKVLLSGGERINGWKRYKGDIWVTTLPEVQEGKWWFRQL